jgi:hypothetical protein
VPISCHLASFSVHPHLGGASQRKSGRWVQAASRCAMPAGEIRIESDVGLGPSYAGGGCSTHVFLGSFAPSRHSGGHWCSGQSCRGHISSSCTSLLLPGQLLTPAGIHGTRRQQHDPGPLRRPGLPGRGPHQSSQIRFITRTQHQRRSNRHSSLSRTHTVKSLPTHNTMYQLSDSVDRWLQYPNT